MEQNISTGSKDMANRPVMMAETDGQHWLLYETKWQDGYTERLYPKQEYPDSLSVLASFMRSGGSHMAGDSTYGSLQEWRESFVNFSGGVRIWPIEF